MRSEYFLALPVLATVANLLFASFLVVVFSPRKVTAQLHLQPGGNIENLRLGFRPTEPERYLTLEEETRKEDDESCQEESSDEDDEPDPMLKAMPIDRPPFVKEVYTRQEISSFYQERTGSRVETTPEFQGQAGKFVNISPHRMELFWENEHGKSFFIANVGPWDNGGTASFPGHKFHFKRRDTKEIVCRFVTEKGTSIYYYDPFVVAGGDDEESVARQGTYSQEGPDTPPWSLQLLGSDDRERYHEHRFNLKFATQYRNFTGGSEWLAHYPKDPPLHKIWRADHYGQEHVVQTYETHFFDIPPVKNLREKYAVKRNDSADVVFPEYRMPGRMNLTIRAVSVAPRAFQIDHFLSEEEVDHVVDVVNGQYSLRRSTTGNKAGTEESDVSETRTSKNTWVPRTASPILDAIYRRAADALRIDEALMRRRSPTEPQPRDPDTFGGGDKWRSLEPINEQMQIVHYDRTEEYTAHHDFGYSERASRSINLCIYLNEGMRGGETAFPRQRNAHSTKGMAMTPEKGKAMIFYMVNPDGNLDDLTQHAARPVLEGEKWFANLWIWDPFRT